MDFEKNFCAVSMRQDNFPNGKQSCFERVDVREVGRLAVASTGSAHGVAQVGDCAGVKNWKERQCKGQKKPASKKSMRVKLVYRRHGDYR
jgi:hypothetical protein